MTFGEPRSVRWPHRPPKPPDRTGEVVVFVPKRTLSAEANVAAFVKLCRTRLTVFGADLAFDAACWDVTEATRRRGSSARDRIYFVRNGPGRRLSDEPFGEPFGSFARAFIRYEQGLRPKRTLAFWMAALRALEHGLRSDSTRPAIHRTTVDALEESVHYLQSRLEPLAAYHVSGFVQHISHFLDENLFVPVPNQWLHSLPRPEQGPRIGPAHEERVRSRLPSRDALEGLATAFNKATAPGDVLIVSAAALQLATNPRICETMTLPSNARIVTLQEGSEKGKALRWWPAKNNPPRMKWVVSSLAPIAERALERILAVTEEARRVARWYEEHPTKIYLPTRFEHLRNQALISRPDANAVLGGTRATAAFRGRRFRWIHGTKHYAFRDLEEYVLSLLPDDFPIFDRTTNIRFSEALLVMPKGLLGHARVEPMPSMIERVSSQHMRAGLGLRPTGASSVFRRLGITRDDGTPVRLSPHSIRHYMSDLVQRNGLAEIDLAKWAGRSVEQNRHYNHMSDAERVDQIRAALARGDSSVSQNSLVRRPPVPRTDDALTLAPMVLPTEIGFCLHDTLMMPCQMHRDCLFCSEHVCVKGDEKRTQTVRRWLEEHERLLARATKLMDEDALGADRWVEHCRQGIVRLRDLLALLEDPNVVDGELVRPALGPAPSRIRLAAEKHGLTLRASSSRLPPHQE